jgi:hypothetical protein
VDNSNIPDTISEIVIFVPGFPGEAYPRDKDEVRVVDIVSKVLMSQGKLFEVISYPGIIDNQRFSFERTKAYTFEVIEKRLSQGYSVSVVGQSLGGLIALLASQKYQIKKLLLITPFLIIPDGPDLLNIISYYSSEFPKLIPTESISIMSQQIIKFKEELNLINNISSSCEKVAIVACSNDEVVPLNLIKEYFNNLYFVKNADILVLDNDHDFSLGKQELEKWLELNV